MKSTGCGCDMYCLNSGPYTSQAAETDQSEVMTKWWLARENGRNSCINLVQWHFSHKKSHMKLPGMAFSLSYTVLEVLTKESHPTPTFSHFAPCSMVFKSEFIIYTIWHFCNAQHVLNWWLENKHPNFSDIQLNRLVSHCLKNSALCNFIWTFLW
jgi:hypothetical protein